MCKDVEVEPVLQDITGEELNEGANTAPDAWLDIYNIYLAESCFDNVIAKWTFCVEELSPK